MSHRQRKLGFYALKCVDSDHILNMFIRHLAPALQYNEISQLGQVRKKSGVFTSHNPYDSGTYEQFSLQSRDIEI